MSKKDFTEGSSTIDGFFDWMRERHRIYVKRFIMKWPKPWSDDPIFQNWKFTNVFRELDTGTIYLRKALKHEDNPVKIVFNTIWYRLFNWYEHIDNLGPLELHEFFKLKDYMMDRYERGLKIFTSAHMTSGKLFEPKVITYLNAIESNMELIHPITKIFTVTSSIQATFKSLLAYPLVGPFTAYEIACDIRFDIPAPVYDALTWANIGPGANRGLRRLGLPVALDSMLNLFKEFHTAERFYPNSVIVNHFYDRDHCTKSPPFELREIEHSLCEFDKYERIRLGQGKPRMKYRGI